MTDAEFAGTLLEDEELFYGLCQAVQNAGEKASILRQPNHVCLLPLEQSGITRRIRPLEINVKQDFSIVNFDKRSITLVGGGAVQAYNFSIKDRLGIVYQNPTKKTPDLDFVWWPIIVLPPNISEILKRNGTPFENPKSFRFFESDMSLDSATQYAVVSFSPAIQEIVNKYEKELMEQLKKFLTLYSSKIIEIATLFYKFNDIHVKFKTGINNVFIAGICNIFGTLVLTIDGIEHDIQIIEMTIHDGASSQISTSLEKVVHDPIFTIHTSSSLSIVSTIELFHNSKKYTVPVLDRLIEQQFYALKQQYKQYYSESRKNKKTLMEKIESHFRRCYFIYYGILWKYMNGEFSYEGLANRPIFLYPKELFDKYNNLFNNTEEWIASCVHDDIKLCGISATNPIFEELCKAGKMLKMELCTPPTVLHTSPPLLSHPPTQMYTTPYSIPYIPQYSSSYPYYYGYPSYGYSYPVGYIEPPISYPQQFNYSGMGTRKRSKKKNTKSIRNRRH